MYSQSQTGPLNEHDYFSTRDSVDPSSINDDVEQDAATDGLQVDDSAVVLDRITKLYTEKIMNDVCLVVGGKDYFAHRLILCASSEVFHVMLMNPNWAESHTMRITLQEPAQCCAVFQDFLTYLYTGKIHINHLNAMPVMALADKYNVLDLISLCKNFMLENIPTASKYNQLMNWLQYSYACGHHQLASASRDYVRWNFQSVAAQEDFVTCEVDLLISLIQLDELAIYDEATLFYCLVRWFEAQDDRSETLVRQVFSYVRFPMMSPRQLADLLICPLTQRYKDFFVELMAVGVAFQSGQTHHISESLLQKNSPQSHLFTPRLYTSEKWGSTLIVEKFSSKLPYHTNTLMMSCPSSCADCETDVCDWVADFHPKGVWFPSCVLIDAWRENNLTLPERVYRTVRFSLTLKDPAEAYVRVAVLIYGVHKGVEHVRCAVVRNFIFTPEEPVLRCDDLLPYSELNPDAFTAEPRRISPFLVGPHRDDLKFQLVIVPLRLDRRRPAAKRIAKETQDRARKKAS